MHRYLCLHQNHYYYCVASYSILIDWFFLIGTDRISRCIGGQTTTCIHLSRGSLRECCRVIVHCGIGGSCDDQRYWGGWAPGKDRRGGIGERTSREGVEGSTEWRKVGKTVEWGLGSDSGRTDRGKASFLDPSVLCAVQKWPFNMHDASDCISTYIAMSTRTVNLCMWGLDVKNLTHAHWYAVTVETRAHIIDWISDTCPRLSLARSRNCIPTVARPHALYNVQAYCNDSQHNWQAVGSFCLSILWMGMGS